MLFYLCNIFYRLVERLSLIRGCRHGWRTTLKHRASLCELFFIFLFLKLLSSTSKLPLAEHELSFN